MFSSRALAEAPPAPPASALGPDLVLDASAEAKRALDAAVSALQEHAADVAAASEAADAARAVEARAQTVLDVADGPAEQAASVALVTARNIREKRERRLVELRKNAAGLAMARSRAAASLREAEQRQEGSALLEELEALALSLEAHAEAIRAAFPRAVRIEEMLARELALSQEERHAAAKLRARALEAVRGLSRLVGLLY